VSDTNAEKKTLYDRVARLVRSNPEAFRAIGEQFDHGETGYSDRAMRQRLAKAKKAFHARGRAARHASTEHRTRAFWRKHADLKGRCENPWSKPRSKADRFIEAWQETLATLDECPLDRRVRADREVMAGRVALMTWLLVDPDADSFEIPITEFQHWTWNALGGKEPRKIALWVEGNAKGVTVDDTVGRYHKRCTLLDRDEDRWLPHLRAAIDVINSVDSHIIEEAHPGVTPSAEVSPPPFGAPAERLRDLSRRQSTPTDRQACDEINAICAQGIRCYKEHADAGVKGFDPALVRLTLTGNSRQDQAKLLNNDLGQPRWLDIVQSVSGRFPGRIAADPGAPEYVLQKRTAVEIPSTSGPGYDWTDREVTVKTCPLKNWPQRASEYADVLDCLNELAGHEGQVAQALPQADSPAIGKAGMAWQDAMKRAEEHVRAHGGAFPSVKRLAEIVGCSRPTIDKAIQKSAYLKARRAEAKSKQSGRTVAMSEPAIEEASERQCDNLTDLIAEQEAENARDERQAKAASTTTRVKLKRFGGFDR